MTQSNAQNLIFSNNANSLVKGLLAIIPVVVISLIIIKVIRGASGSMVN